MVGIFFIARLGSTRLENKHLINVNGLTFIEWLVARFRIAFQDEINNGLVKLFITTSNRAENHEFETIFKNEQIHIFYGDDENIPKRQFECAEENKISKIISIDGDDILCSTMAARKVLDQLMRNSKIVKTIGLPLGMNVIGYSTDYLKMSLLKSENIKLETGWGKIFNNQDVLIIKEEYPSDIENLRMTLDYQEDALFFKAIFEFVGNSILSMDDSILIEIIKKNSFERINSFLNEEYWINFNTKKQFEI